MAAAAAEADLRTANQEASELRGQISNLQGVLNSTMSELGQAKEEARRAEPAVAEPKAQLDMIPPTR